MIDMLIKFWQQTHLTYLEGKLRKGMYWYLTACLVVIGCVYYFMIWEGFIGIAVLFSVFAGMKLPVGGVPIDVVKAAGIILIMRYVLMSGIDALAKKTPENVEFRLREIESKIGELHKLAFGDIDDVIELRKGKPKQKNGGMKNGANDKVKGKKQRSVQPA